MSNTGMFYVSAADGDLVRLEILPTGMANRVPLDGSVNTALQVALSILEACKMSREADKMPVSARHERVIADLRNLCSETGPS